MSEHKIEDYPEIQGNYYLRGRDQGASRKLVGKIGIVSCYIKRGGKAWSESEKSKYDKELCRAIEWFHTEAHNFGVPLHIDRYFYEIDVPADAEPVRTFDYIKNFLNSDTMEIAQSALERNMGYDEMPFIFVYNEKGRSFASLQQRDACYVANENSTVFISSAFSHTTIIHELLHQFGAQDYYFPAEVMERAKHYYGNSIMGVGMPEMDDLTAYLIGWKNTISNVTYWFLRDTNWVNDENYGKFLEEEWAKKWF